MNPSDQISVLFLSSWYPNRVLPKNGNFVQKHAQAVARKANVASLHVISDPQAIDFEISAQNVEGVYEVIVYYPKSKKWRPDKKYRLYLEAHRRGYAHIRKEWGEVDITHLNIIYPAGLFALELKEKYNIPFVLSENWTAWLPINPYQFTPIERHFIKKIGAQTAVFCPVSEDLQQAFMNFGFEGPFHIVPNVVDVDTFVFEKKASFPPIKILHVSTFKEEHKNISGILRVLSKMQGMRTDFEVTMVGNKFGDMYSDTISELGISPDLLNILPEIATEEIASLMKAHHIFVLFSNYENLPCVVAEAHCMGMVVVGSDVGGTREMINEHNGLIVQARDEAGLLDNLIQVMDNLASYHPSAIQAQASSRYSYDSVGETFVGIYREVLGNFIA